jgi:hypothetical protein
LETQKMQNDTDELIEAVRTIADADFDASDTFGANRIAKRPSESPKMDFYRPGERSEHGSPFEVTPTTCPKYSGLPSGRDPDNEEKRGAWQLQQEYIAGRLGKNEEENGRLWNTAKWIDKIIRTSMMPADAVKSLNLYADNFYEVIPDDKRRGSTGEDKAASDDENNGFEFSGVNIDLRDKERLALTLSDYDLLRLWDYFAAHEKAAKIDVSKLVGSADPLAERIDVPGPIERQTAIKIARILMTQMRSLWHPVNRAITDHATMKSLGESQNVGDGVAAAVGRARVIEGLRLAESIRKGLSRQDRAFSLWLDQIHAKQTPVTSAEWSLTNRYKLGSVDEIVSGTLAVLSKERLPMPVRAPTGHYWNLAAGPVMKLADNDDSRRIDSIAGKAA